MSLPSPAFSGTWGTLYWLSGNGRGYSHYALTRRAGKKYVSFCPSSSPPPILCASVWLSSPMDSFLKRNFFYFILSSGFNGKKSTWGTIPTAAGWILQLLQMNPVQVPSQLSHLEKRQSSTGRANGYVPSVRLPGHRALPQHPIITYYGWV